MHETSDRFTWWHRDELQVVFVYVVIILFFGRTLILEVVLLGLGLLPVGGFWLIRWWGRTDRHPELVSRLLRHLPRHPWDRSRLAMSILSTAIVGALFWHRLSLFLLDDAARVPVEQSLATPLDLYWVLFLGWYASVWLVVALFLLYKWKTDADPTEHTYLEGLVGSMYFYHGLPTKSRVATFVAGFLLGGLPTAYAVQIDPTTPGGHQIAVYLIIPVAALILFGAWFASRWVGSTPSGEV